MRILVIFLLVCLRLIASENVVVQVEHGLLEGELLDLVTNDGQYYSFKGIPYATAPLGKLRFRAPQDLEAWNGTKSAKQFGSVCPQVDIMFGGYIPGSEDCLFLNVYTPDLTPEEPLPVILFIFGGGMKSGTGNVYGPDFLVPHGVVLVTFNYRLDALGFLSLDTEEIPGNAGMKDQVAVMKWVQKNIASFGGDADQVTLFGFSSGGTSVGWHLLSPLSKGLFKRAIAMSGSPYEDWALAIEPRRRAFALARDFGLVTTDTNELVEFLENQPVEHFVNKSPILHALDPFLKDHTKLYAFTTSVEKNFGDSNFLVAPPAELIKAGLNQDVDLMITQASDEALIYASGLSKLKNLYEIYQELYVPLNYLMACPPSKILELSDKIQQFYFNGIDSTASNNITLKAFMDYLSDSGFNTKLHTFYASLQGSENSTTKKYWGQFSAMTERNYFGKRGLAYNLTGTSHMDDMFYLFNMQEMNTTIDKNGESYKIIQQTCKLFTNFAKYGNPTPDSTLGVVWPPYESTNQSYLDINSELTVKERLHIERLSFWLNFMNETTIECGM